jgi:hypothetical protein
MDKQEIRAKALELAVRQLVLYPPILDNIYKNSLDHDPAAWAKGDGFLSEIIRLSTKYEEHLNRA